MNEGEYEKLCRDIRHSTQKIANDIFLNRRDQVLTQLQARGLALSTDTAALTIKKGRPKK
jgi:hypothetical protein